VDWLTKYPLSDYRIGDLQLLSRVPGELRLLLFLAVVGVSVYAYAGVRQRLRRPVYLRLLALRLASLALLVLILGVPTLRRLDPRDNPVFAAVLVDTSRSMGIADATTAAGTLPRLEAARRLLLGEAGQTGLLADLAGTARVPVYGFDLDARRVVDPTELAATGPFTNVFRSARTVEADLRALPLASVILVSDGCRNEGGPLDEVARLFQGQGVPLHVVGVGQAPPPRDGEIVSVVAPRRVRRNTAAEVVVTIRHTDIAGPIEVRLVRGDTVVLTQSLEPTPGTDFERLSLHFTPDHDGMAVYRAEIPVAEGETVTENNRREFTIEIQDDRLPVLYAEGSPRLEYRFLRRALFRDPNFRVVGLLRLASDRFYVQGADESEAWLTEGFPSTPERLFRFQAVILGDLEAAMFTPAQLALLEEFVKTRGGGLLMLGGVNSFGLGGYAGTPVARLLPVRVGPADPAYSDEHLQAQPSAEALAHPVLQLLPDAEQNRRLWASVPDLIGITPVSGVKPDATLLLADRRAGRPVLAVQNYGAGRVGAFTSGGSWYWQVSMPASDETHERFWKQVIRWLVLGARDHLTVETDAEIYARLSPVLIRAAVLHQDLRPNNDAQVSASIRDPLGNTTDIPLEWTLSEEGVYECTYTPEIEGNYEVSVRVEAAETDKAVTGFLVSEPLQEFSDAGLKREALEAAARLGGGRYFGSEDAAALAQQVGQDVRALQRTGRVGGRSPIWDMPLLFLLLLGLLAAEWVTRRRNGLA
jgi:uncharacterized membrane protein